MKIFNKINANAVGVDAHIDPKNSKHKIKILLIILLIVLISSGIGAYAGYNYGAGEIGYTRSGSSVTTVEGALNELYGIKTNLNNLNSSINQTNAVASDILSGKKAYTTNGLITGSFDKIYAEGDKKYDKTNDKLEVTGLPFKPKMVLLYNKTAKAFIIAEPHPGGIATVCQLEGNVFNNNNALEYVCYSSLLDDGFTFFNFAEPWNTLTYHWIAIK